MWLLSECNVLQVTAGKHTPRASLRGQQGPPPEHPQQPPASPHGRERGRVWGTLRPLPACYYQLIHRG